MIPSLETPRYTDPWTTRRISRRRLLTGAVTAAALATPLRWLASPGAVTAIATPARPTPAAGFDASVPTAWFDLLARLVRETPGYTPPVASRAFGCAGVVLYEAVLPGIEGAASLAGVLNDLGPSPAAGRNTAYHWPSVANTALAAMARELFPTAPVGLQIEIDALEARFAGDAPRGILARSVDRGRTVAAAVAHWTRSDGGHEAYLRNFPSDYTPPQGSGLWVPTPPGFQPALQPSWGENRCMALASSADCDPGPPPTFSTSEDSAFFAEAIEVYETVNGLSEEQREIALFWSDDPGQTATPPGHSISILTQVLQDQDRSLADAAEAYARLGAAVCDAFIACWRTKYVHNVLRPITYVRRHIDPAWGNPLPLTTPPFPEYTSGHSVQSGAAAAVLTALFGDLAFVDHTHDDRALAPRAFASFGEMADEAAISRFYGGIHYRAAIERGLVQGRCIGELVATLPLRA